MKKVKRSPHHKQGLETSKLQALDKLAASALPAPGNTSLQIDGIKVIIPQALFESDLQPNPTPTDVAADLEILSFLPESQLPLPSQENSNAVDFTPALVDTPIALADSQPPPTPDAPTISEPQAIMPRSTASIRLTPRDPHWLLVEWDFPNGISHIDPVLRLFVHNAASDPILALPLPSDTRYCFLPVTQAGCYYVAQLGMIARGVFEVLCTSEAVATPPDCPSTAPAVVQFGAFRLETVPPPPVEAVEPAVVEARGQPSYGSDLPAPGDSFEQSTPFEDFTKEMGCPREQEWLTWLQNSELPAPTELVDPSEQVVDQTLGPCASRKWTHNQDAAMDRLLTMVSPGEPEKSQTPSSIVTAEMIDRGILEQNAQSTPDGSVPSSLGVAVPTPAKKSDFWFFADAELIVYGATEPDAQVKAGGQHVPLRPDGSFSFRLAFPDGPRQLEINAVSASGEHVRKALLKFDRQTAME
jgi:hypothetical protein